MSDGLSDAGPRADERTGDAAAGSASRPESPGTGGASTPAGLTSESRVVLDRDGIGRAVRRMAHEIVERNQGSTGVVLVGLMKGGVWLAEAIGESLAALGEQVPVGRIDASFYRDDLGLRDVSPSSSDLPVNIDDRVVVLCDDVLFTGRTVRAALDALRAYGRPRVVQLAVMVDRGHRELPIRPDFIGKNLPTARSERVDADPNGVVIA